MAHSPYYTQGPRCALYRGGVLLPDPSPHGGSMVEFECKGCERKWDYYGHKTYIEFCPRCREEEEKYEASGPRYPKLVEE